MPEKQYFTGIDIINAPRIESLTVTEDGTYTPSSGVIGYNPVVVNTNQPWQPLEDGYSNFWFELTNDTLSPWLKFSAKTESAVIDWGDGSGEVALDTLTPTHTYSKPGRYIVKVKGVTGIGAQNSLPRNDYNFVLKYAELNDEVTSLGGSAFKYCVMLKFIKITAKNITINQYVFYGCSNLIKVLGYSGSISNSMFYLCINLMDCVFDNTATSIGSSAYHYCSGLTSITLPSSITYIGAYAFRFCDSLEEIHIQATTPPSVNGSIISSLPSNYIIYVPVGYGDTYKAASGWSAYADHILEEGQTPNRAMLAKFNSNNTDNEEMR